jgi:hypothetical protein
MAVTCDARTLPRIHLLKIPSGYPGTLKTAAHMGRLIAEGAKDFRVRRAAIDVLIRHGVRPKDYLGEIQALFEWVQRHIRYTRDTVRVEVLHSARRMLELRAGDCDDFSILLGALLESVGHPVRLVLTGPDRRKPRLFSHVFLQAFCQGRWISLDATMPYPIGWAPRAPVRKVIAIHRRSNMPADDRDLQGLGAAAVPDWLRGLIRSVRREALTPKDARVKSLWDLLRGRQLLDRDPWVKSLLRRCWQGLAARQRPRTTRRLVAQLRAWSILPPRRTAPSGPPSIHTTIRTVQPMRRVVMRRVAAARPARLRPVRAVRMRPVGRGGRW